MTETSEKVVQIPLLDQAAAAIKDKGSFQKELTGQELAEIMGSVVKSLTAGQEAVRATVTTMQVQIERQQGTVAGNIQVEKPITATIGVRCTLGNDTAPNRLRLVGLDVEEKASFAAKLPLKAVNIKRKAQHALRDPNQALFTAFGSQLEPKGVRLTGIGLHFGDTTLAVALNGQPIVRK